jgi:hypothetical protein
MVSYMVLATQGCGKEDSMVLLHGLDNLCCVSYDSTLVLSSRIVVKGHVVRQVSLKGM